MKNQFFTQTHFSDLLSKIHYAPSLDNLIIRNWPYFGVDWSYRYGGKVLQFFEYSKLFFHLERSCKLFNGLNDFKVTPYVCQNHTDDDIHSDHSFLDTLGIPLNSTLNTGSRGCLADIIFGISDAVYPYLTIIKSGLIYS